MSALMDYYASPNALTPGMDVDTPTQSQNCTPRADSVSNTPTSEYNKRKRAGTCDPTLLSPRGKSYSEPALQRSS